MSPDFLSMQSSLLHGTAQPTLPNDPSARIVRCLPTPKPGTKRAMP